LDAGLGRRLLDPFRSIDDDIGRRGECRGHP
jgi:hypothetical protein